MKIWKKIVLVLGIFCLLLGILNYDFFWQNVRFTFVQPEVVEVSTSSRPTIQPPNTLSIESLGINAPIIYIDETGEPAFQKALLSGVVHYPKTANPGMAGNVYIFGHSSDYLWSKGQYKTVFALLPRIEKGAAIVVSDSKGKAFTYIVTNTFVASAKDVKYLDQGNFEKKLLTLQTSYPIGTALKRYIVQAEMRE